MCFSLNFQTANATNAPPKFLVAASTRERSSIELNAIAGIYVYVCRYYRMDGKNVTKLAFGSDIISR